jgi:choline-sulfatase
MIGERGMWFKFNPFEGSVRVPLIGMGPRIPAGQMEPALTTLADLLPTFVDIASDGKFDSYASAIDGRSLLDLPAAGSDENIVFFEYCGEGVHAPALMCRDKNIKYISCGDDPEMMFNLEIDPNEQNNLAVNPRYAKTLTTMRAHVAKRWDEPNLAERVKTSQKNRLFVQEAMKQGVFPSWDYTPPFDASRAYVRGAIDPNTTATKARKRFPFVPTTPPQNPRR